MINNLPNELNLLIRELARLPGIGIKSASRIAFYLLRNDQEESLQLSRQIENAVTNLEFCSICHNVTSDDPCPICSDTSRDTSVICIIEEPNDLFAIESSGNYNGMYHVLGGVLSPLSGVGPADLHIDSLVERLKDNPVQELIIATNPNAEGDATALYIADLLKDVGLKITRIARGLPTGGDLEFSDPTTLGKAIEGRREEFK